MNFRRSSKYCRGISSIVSILILVQMFLISIFTIYLIFIGYGSICYQNHIEGSIVGKMFEVERYIKNVSGYYDIEGNCELIIHGKILYIPPNSYTIFRNILLIKCINGIAYMAFPSTSFIWG